jgi:hypothetical protein
LTHFVVACKVLIRASKILGLDFDAILLNKYQFYNLWLDPTRARTHDLPHSR